MKNCTKCGKELFDEAVICPGCGCPVEILKPIIKCDYKLKLSKTKMFVIAGFVLVCLGFFSWFFSDLVDMIFVVIMELIVSVTTKSLPGISLYHACENIANHLSIVCFFVAEFLFVMPRSKFNSSFKTENAVLYMNNKAQYKKDAKEKCKKLEDEIPFFKISVYFAIISLILFVISVFIPSLRLITG